MSHALKLKNNRITNGDGKYACCRVPRSVSKLIGDLCRADREPISRHVRPCDRRDFSGIVRSCRFRPRRHSTSRCQVGRDAVLYGLGTVHDLWRRRV